MAVKKRGIVARPGKHKDEVVSAATLRRAVQFQNRIPMIVGPHPAGGYSSPDDWIGTVSTVWNDEKQRVDGEFWFFDEEWHRVPDEVKRKIANNEEIHLSTCYDTSTNEDKEQLWRKWDHIALGVPNPAMTDVGVNVRMESELPDSLRMEEEPVITGEKTEPSKKLELTPAQLTQVIDTAVEKALNKKAPVEEETPKVEETEKAPEAEEEARPEPEPEMVLPASAPPKKKMEGVEVMDDGWWKF